MELTVHLTPQVCAHSAWNAFRPRRRWWQRERERPAHPVLRGEGQLPCLEMIWLPCYLADYGVDGLQRPAARRTITAMLEGCSGSFAVFAAEEALCEGAPPAAEVLPAAVPPAEAARIMGERLITGLHYQRGVTRSIRIASGPELRLAAWPYWLYYYEQRGTLDIAVLDAVIGDRAGRQTRAGILQAIMRSDAPAHSGV